MRIIDHRQCTHYEKLYMDMSLALCDYVRFKSFRLALVVVATAEYWSTSISERASPGEHTEVGHGGWVPVVQFERLNKQSL